MCYVIEFEYQNRKGEKCLGRWMEIASSQEEAVQKLKKCYRDYYRETVTEIITITEKLFPE